MVGPTLLHAHAESENGTVFVRHPIGCKPVLVLTTHAPDGQENSLAFVLWPAFPWSLVTSEPRAKVGQAVQPSLHEPQAALLHRVPESNLSQMAVGRKTGAKIAPWQMEIKTQTCVTTAV